MRIKDQILQVINTNTIKESSLTFFSTIINGILGVVFYIIIARGLGPANFGIFAVAVTVLTLIADIGNLGTDTGLIRFIGKYRFNNEVKTLRFVKLGFEVKIVAWLVILIGGWFLAPFLAQSVFSKNEMVSPLRIAMVGTGGALLFSFATSSLQAFQRYLSWSFVNIGSNATRLLILFILMSLGILNLGNGLLIYILIPFFGFFVSIFLLPNFFTVKSGYEVGREFFHYNKWVAVFVVIAALSSRLDTFLVARFLPASSIGLYSAANQLTAVVPQLVFALAAVVAPKIASITSPIEITKYLKKLFLLCLGLGVIGIMVIPFIAYLIPIFFGSSYQQSIGVFVILFLAQLVFLISLPFHQAVFYYFAKPSVFVLISVIHLIIIGVFGWILISTMGIYGAAWAVLIGTASNFIIPLVWVASKLDKKTS